MVFWCNVYCEVSSEYGFTVRGGCAGGVELRCTLSYCSAGKFDEPLQSR